MPKGKKFDAAEKHFEKKRLKYEHEIKYLESQLDIARKDAKRYRDLYEFDERNIQELNKMIDWLIEHSGLSKDEIKAAVENDLKVKDMFEWLLKYDSLFFMNLGEGLLGYGKTIM